MADKKEEARRRLKERQVNKKRFKLPEGETTFRVLPNAKGIVKKEYVEYAMHSEVGPRKSYIRCGKNIEGAGECFLCDEVIPKLEKQGGSSHRQMAVRMARRDVFVIQIAYKDESTDKWQGPVKWELAPTLANALLGIMSRRDVSHPEKGYNLTISRTGTGMTDTRYGQMEREEEASEAPEEVLGRLKPFSEVIQKYDEKAMKAAYYGHEQEDEDSAVVVSDDDDAAEEPEKSKKKSSDDDDEDETPKSKKKSKSSDDDDDSVEKTSDDDDFEEAEEEKPKSKKKSSDDDDDVVEPDDDDIPSLDDDDEDEKSKSKKKLKDEDEEVDDEPKSKKKSKKSREEDKEEPEHEEEEESPKGKKRPKASDDDDF